MPRHCTHKNRKSSEEPGKVTCLDCHRSFVPRSSLIRHGTYEGYNKHQRVRSGAWAWPACPKCNEAARVWRSEYAHRPQAQAAQRLRHSARAAALARLRRMYPADFQAGLAAEDAARGIKSRKRSVPVLWEPVMHQLLKALGVDHNDLARSVAGGWATSREREVSRLVRQLRQLHAEAERDPGRYHHPRG